MRFPHDNKLVGRNGYAECVGGEVWDEGDWVYFVDAVWREVARRTINESKPSSRHYVRG
jgi:hypothetical protein